MRIRNRQSFRDLRHLRGEWELLVDGVVVRRGVLRSPVVSAGETIDVPVPASVPTTGDVRLTLRWFLRRDEPWAAAGHLVAWDQVVLRQRSPKVKKPIGAKSTKVTPSAWVDGIEPTVTIWRAAVDNDGFKNMPEIVGFGGSLRRWQSQHVDTRDGGLVKQATKRAVNTDGSISFRHVVDVPKDLDDLPRVGVTFPVPPRFTRVRWVGEGPHECYPVG